MKTPVYTCTLKRWRWDDGAYLTRIIFDEMTQGEMEETGYGISTRIQDGANRILIVNCKQQSVSFGNSIWTFEEFITLDWHDIWGEG
jgi:hypothetical protein